jgi:hypothetical protein
MTSDKNTGVPEERNVGRPTTQDCWATILLVTTATVLYSYHLGRQALGPSEAYSALAAAQKNVVEAAEKALEFDPGKPLLYHLLLHWFCSVFGTSELALRAFSLIFGLASLIMVFAYGKELFGVQIGFAAAAIWAFNPLALLLARWARMYSMLVAVTLGHLLLMARLRRQHGMTCSVMAGVLGAAMLYTHLAGWLVIGVDLLVVMREFRDEGRSPSALPVILSVLMFLPLTHLAVMQTRQLLLGHWLDWIGVCHHSGISRLVVAGLAAAVVLWLLTGLRATSETCELVVRCWMYCLVPIFALGVSSVVVRPLFEVRYVAPSFAVAAVAVAWTLDQNGKRLRNDVVCGLVAFFLLSVPCTYAAQDQPWRKIALCIRQGSVHDAIFFESGFFSPAKVIGDSSNEGFPQGFFAVPFQYYYKGSNPENALPEDAPVQARKLIADAVRKQGGAWLISGKARAAALAELPSGAEFRLDFEQDFSRVLLLHLRRVDSHVTPTPLAYSESDSD